jgi:hypothetical protein|tara:strand:- start:830 stop:1129 length:300 start_codon:yes stop_codon:yes gene_type:complete
MSLINRIFENNISKNIAATLGAFITTISLTVCITLLWPFGDVVEQIFAGATFFFVFWASLFYWAILAENGAWAWIRMLIILLPALAVITISFLLKSQTQ